MSKTTRPTIDLAALASALSSMGVELPTAGTANAAVAPTARTVKSGSNAAAKPARPAVDYSAYHIATATFRGFHVVTFTKDGARPITLGYSKIRMVLAHAEALRKLVS